MIDGWLGRSQWREQRSSKRAASGWLALVGVLAAFAGGFWCGGKFGPNAGANTARLDAKPGKTAGFIEDSPIKLAGQFLMAAAYLNLPAAEAKAKAGALAEYLQQQRLEKARPYRYTTPKGPVWVVAVYYDGESELRATCERMRSLPRDAGDAEFASLRQAQESSPGGWPKSYDSQ